MASAILGHRRVDGKPMSFAFNTTSALGVLLASANLAEPVLVDGVVRHDYVDPDVQVTILAVVDETGSAALKDIVAALSGHPKPVGAVLVMVKARTLRTDGGIVDLNTRVYRALPPDHDGDVPAGASNAPSGDSPSGSDIGAAEPDMEALREIRVSYPYAPAIFCVTGADRRTLRPETLLGRPGFYVAFWGREIYVGASKDLVTRVTKGGHLLSPRPADRIIAIVDRTGQLTWDGAQVGERLLYRALTETGELVGRNEEPSGGQVDEPTFKLVHDLVAASVLALRREGLLSAVVTTAKAAGAGSVPRPKQQLFAKRAEQDGDGALYRLEACGVKAEARVDNTSWTLLAGSAVRGNVMPSAHPSALQRRVELLHSGGLVQRGRDYLLTRDLQFGSATGAAHFVVGSKTRADIWSAVDAPKPQRSL